MRTETTDGVMARWSERRRRARELGERYPHAAQQLALYLALLDVQEPAYRDALDDPPAASSLPAYVAERVLKAIVDRSVAHGPPALRAAAREGWGDGAGEKAVAKWLRDEPQDPVSRYLARAAAGPVLEALGRDAGLAPDDPADDRRCPVCGGLPQLSYFPAEDDALVTAPRRLLCARCHHAWRYARMTCAGCGEQSGAKLPIYGEAERLPHLRADACETCGRYLLTVDLRKDPRAVPVVDELVGVPLDLYARDQGKRKIILNLMGT